jgi:hypothetical protein
MLIILTPINKYSYYFRVGQCDSWLLAVLGEKKCSFTKMVLEAAALISSRQHPTVEIAAPMSHFQKKSMF